MTLGYPTFDLGRFDLNSGEVLHDGRLAYQTYGALNPAKDNAVVLPTFYTGTHWRNEGFFGPGRALDPAHHFIISINMFGNGLSSSPSNAPDGQSGSRFPQVTLWDNVRAQHTLVTEHLGIERLRLVAGWSMAGCQSYQWGAQYPDMVDAILPFCASTKTSPHNIVFLEGVKAALQADQTWNNGDYDAQPERGLRAFGRVYAGWAFSQTWYRNGLYKNLGFETVEELLVDWENDHVDNWDANNLLVKLRAWQMGDISANVLYGGDFAKSLAAISARAIVMPSSSDLYFPPKDNEIEVAGMANAELRVYETDWGHCVASPGNDAGFAAFLDDALAELLAT